MTTVIIALVIFLFFLVGLIVVRVKSRDRFEIKNTDVVLALVPVALWLFFDGENPQVCIWRGPN